MLRSTGMGLLVLIAVTAWSGVSGAAEMMVLHNARIHTVDTARPWADAVAIDADGIIAAVGTEAEVSAVAGGDADYVDMDGRLVLPGFQDAHLHAVEAGINAAMCYIPWDAAIADIRYILEDCPQNGRFADQGWIVGAGIDVGLLIEEGINPIAELDRAYPRSPVLILDSLGHGAVANSAAMRAVGYDQLTHDPPGGLLVRDWNTGALTGVVLENAQQKLRDAAFPPSKGNRDRAYESLLDALNRLAENGITTVSDAGGFWRQAQTEAWARAEAAGTLTVRASNALYVYPDMDMTRQLPALKSRFSNDPDALVRMNQAKIYVDGILGLATGAMYEPYEPGLELPPEAARGFEYFERETLFRYAKALSRAGFQLHFHVTGDRGAGLALDAIAGADPASGPHRLTHLYLVAENDRGRFRELGAVADLQLAPSSVDAGYAAYLGDLIGGRAADLMPARELHEAGALVTLSSDWDADELSPLVKLRTVLTRLDRPIPDLATALRMMTLNPAILLRHDDRTGSISIGKYADLVVLDRNIFDLPVDMIDRAQIVATLLQGDPVYDVHGLF